MHFGVCADGEGGLRCWGLMGFLPGEFVCAAEVEEFEGAAGAVAGGDVAVGGVLVVELVDDELRRDLGGGRGGRYMWASLEGTMRRSSPTRAFPVARIRFSPLAVRGMSVVPVCLPLRDHSVSP